MLDKSSMHRLIGAGIMLVAAVSVLPIILDGERPADLGMSVTSPSPAPNIPEANIKKVQKLPVVKKQTLLPAEQKEKKSSNEKIAAVKKIESSVKAESSKNTALQAKTIESKAIESKVTPVITKKAVTPPKAVINTQEKGAVVVKKIDSAKSKPSRWAVQIASFKNRNNATELVKKLQAANYPAYNVTTNTLYKVFVGPEIKKTRANEVKEEIKKQFRLEGFVVKYSSN